MMVDFSEWLREELTKRDWKPTELARRADLDDGIISRALSGARVPSTKSLKKIADALDVPVTEILQQVDIIPPSEETELSRRAVALARRIEKLNPDFQELVESTINTLLQQSERQKRNGKK